MEKKIMEGETLILVDPQNYEGFSCHPAFDSTVRKVVSAIIRPLPESKTGWVMLEIFFEGNYRFSGSSPSSRGAKQMFAFQCYKGSKWLTVSKEQTK